MEDYKPNSHKYKEELKNSTGETKKVEKIVSGKVTTKKKNDFQKFAEDFVREDISKIKSYIWNDLIVPTIKNTIWDAFTNSLDMILFGESGGHSKKKSPASKVSYGKYYEKERNKPSYGNSNSRDIYDYDEIILNNRGEAEDVITRMMEIMDEYDGMVSVADLYELVGVSSRYTDNNYGWTDLSTARVERVKDGYLLKLPRIQSLK